MVPYTLLRGDCLTLLPAMNPDSVDLIVTSPPFNCRKDYGAGFRDEMPWPDYYSWMGLVLDACYRVLRVGGTIAVNVPGVVRWQADHAYAHTWSDFDPDYKTHRNGEKVVGKGRIEPIGFRLFAMLQERDRHVREPLVWVKGSEGNAICSDYRMGCDSDPYLRPCHEWVLLGSKGRWFHRGGTGRRGDEACPFLDNSKDSYLLSPLASSFTLQCFDSLVEAIAVSEDVGMKTAVDGRQRQIAHLDDKFGLFALHSQEREQAFNGGDSLALPYLPTPHFCPGCGLGPWADRATEVALQEIGDCLVTLPDRHYLVIHGGHVFGLCPHLLAGDGKTSVTVHDPCKVRDVDVGIVFHRRLPRNEGCRAVQVFDSLMEASAFFQRQRIDLSASGVFETGVFDQQFGLLVFDPQIRQYDSAEIGCIMRCKTPIPNWCPACGWRLSLSQAPSEVLVDFRERTWINLGHGHALRIAEGACSLVEESDESDVSVAVDDACNIRPKVVFHTMIIPHTPAASKDVYFMTPDRCAGHPAVFPVELPRRLIQLFTHAPDAVVLDPFCGAGATGMAAAELGRRFIGIEQNEAFVRLAERRIHSIAAQGNLWPVGAESSGAEVNHALLSR